MSYRRILALLAGTLTGGRQPEALAELVRETNGLTFDLYDELVSETPAENLVASPVSSTMAVTMAYAGARGDTRDQMREALGYPLDDHTLHAVFNTLQRELNSRGEEIDKARLPSNYEADDDLLPFQLSFVNAVWGQADYSFRGDYLTLLENQYGGGLQEVDYRSDPETAREEINAWVANQTEDRITDLLPKGALDELTRLVLINAIYFLANWYRPFEENATSNEPFTTLDGSTVAVPMMTQNETFPYAEVNGAKAVDLPYVGKEVSMLVILPPEGEFESYERAFARAGLTELVEAFDTREGTVTLPRFEFDSGFALKEALEALGIPIAFNQQEADFSGLARLDERDENLSIDNVYHETYIAVDEEGTEAAAATAVAGAMAVDVPRKPFEFVADRPFLFVIRDRPTDTVLFLGRVIDAGAAQ